MIYYGSSNNPIYYGANEATIYYGSDLIYPTTITGISINSSVEIPKAGGSKTIRLASESNWEILVDTAATWITSVSPSTGTSGRSQITITCSENTGSTVLTSVITARTTDLSYSATCEVTQNIGLGIVLVDHLGNTNNQGYSQNNVYSFDEGITEIHHYDYDFTGIKGIMSRNEFSSFSEYPGAFIPYTNTQLTYFEIDASTVRYLAYVFGEVWGSPGNQTLKTAIFHNTNNIVSLRKAFMECRALETVQFDSLANATQSAENNQFYRCYALQNFTVTALPDININWGFDSCNALTVTSLNNIIAALPSTSNSRTLTLGATNLAKLTQAEKDVAINKGWTLN